VHTPAAQVSVWVQALPSLQSVPFVTMPWMHPVSGLQLSVVHGLPSSHEMTALVHDPPEHRPAATWHLSFVQAVPSAYFWQAPAPSHLPFVLHVEAPRSVQNVEGAGVPGGSGAQAPVPDTLHAWQAGQLELPQQTPSTQLPLMHWVPPAHVRPLALSAQLPAPWQV
jgi:hypothetical protein